MLSIMTYYTKRIFEYPRIPTKPSGFRTYKVLIIIESNYLHSTVNKRLIGYLQSTVNSRKYPVLLQESRKDFDQSAHAIFFILKFNVRQLLLLCDTVCFYIGLSAYRIPLAGVRTFSKLFRFLIKILSPLIFTTLWINSADDKLLIYIFLLFHENSL